MKLYTDFTHQTTVYKLALQNIPYMFFIYVPTITVRSPHFIFAEPGFCFVCQTTWT
jgi:hypothetical protein